VRRAARLSVNARRRVGFRTLIPDSVCAGRRSGPDPAGIEGPVDGRAAGAQDPGHLGDLAAIGDQLAGVAALLRGERAGSGPRNCPGIDGAFPDQVRDAAGIDLRTAAGRLGHAAGGAMTLKVYAHRTRPDDQRAAELLARELRARRSGHI
jgi:hypothetical protein